MARKTVKAGNSTAVADVGRAAAYRDEAWQDRLRTVGAARFIDVDWSTRDKPTWPLPVDRTDIPQRGDGD